MQTKRIVVSILMTAYLLPAAAQKIVRQMEDAHELTLASLTLPLHLPGPMSFVPCDGCANQALTIVAGTSFLVDGEALEFAAFAEVSNAIRSVAGRASQTPVYIFFDVQSQQVNRVLLRNSSTR